jgi:hypothetical protein
MRNIIATFIRRIRNYNNETNTNMNAINKTIMNIDNTSICAEEDTSNPFALEHLDGYDITEARYIRDTDGKWIVVDTRYIRNTNEEIDM